jgi:hypothetical protein
MLAMDLKSSGKKAYKINTIKILFRHLYSVKVDTVLPIYWYHLVVLTTK